MKKAYQKPKIMFESFLMNGSIATAGCEITDPYDDRLEFEGKGYLFGNDCGFKVPISGGDGEENGICYHTMTSGINLFDS